MKIRRLIATLKKHDPDEEICLELDTQETVPLQSAYVIKERGKNRLVFSTRWDIFPIEKGDE